MQDEQDRGNAPREPQRVLVIAAHPDDPEFGAGGTVAKWVREGKEVYYLLCTRGDKGSDDPNMLPGRLMDLREKEQRAAAAALGVKQVEFLGFRDGEIEPSRELRRALVYAIRKIRPEIVVTHDPATIYGTEFINHPDHRAVGTAALDAIYPTARDRLQFPEQLAEGLQPFKVKEVYLWGAQAPNAWVDISETFDVKIAALTRHATQIPTPNGLVDRMRERARTIGASQGIPLAEAFRKIEMAR